MLKTLKSKIALVAVTALGAGLMVVAAPAARAAVVANDLNMVQTGSTTAVKLAAGADNVAARAGVQTLVISEAAAIVAADAYDLVLSTGSSVADAAGVTAVIAGAVTITAASDAQVGGAAGDLGTEVINAGADNGVAIGKLVARVPGAGVAVAPSISLTTASLAAGTYTLWADTTPATAITTDAGEFFPSQLLLLLQQELLLQFHGRKILVKSIQQQLTMQPPSP